MSDDSTWQKVYAATAAGEQELRARTTSLADTELELLVRIDGRLTLGQIRGGMAAAGDALLSAFQTLLKRSLVQEAVLDPFTLDFVHAVAPSPDDRALEEIEPGFGSLRKKGYYVRIARRGQPVAAERPQRVLSVIVIEDDATVRMFLQTLLKLQGFRVRVAGSRSEVVGELNGKPPPDLVLLDVQLPDINGFEILARLKAHAVLRHAPVIMLTGADTREAVIRGITGGADGYLTKPVDTESLLRAVNAVLGLPEADPEDVWHTDPKDRKYE